MLKGKYEFAEHVVMIESMYNEIHNMCKDYKTDKEATDYIKISKADIEYEAKKSIMDDIKLGKEPYMYPKEYLETLAVYRKIAEKFLKYNIILFHGSAIAVDKAAYIFTAKSGTGKSTHTRLWKEKFQERMTYVNDDKPLIKIDDDKVYVYGTPWDGKHRLSTNTKVELKAIALLERSKNNRIESISYGKAFSMLMQQVYRPDNKEDMKETISLLEKMSNNIGLYRLGCNMEKEACDVAYNGMR